MAWRLLVPGLPLLLRRLPPPDQIQWNEALTNTLQAPQNVNASGADRTVLADARIRDTLNAAIADALRNGAGGARQYLLLYSRDWAIPLEAIDLQIAVWHGAADAIIPVGHAHWYAKNLPKVRAKVFPNEGRFSLPVRKAEAILNDLLARGVDNALLPPVQAGHDVRIRASQGSEADSR